MDPASETRGRAGDTRQPAGDGSPRRASVGRVLVAIAVFAPALLILTVFLGKQGSIYGYHVHAVKWPWIVADVALLVVGMLLMRGEDL